MIIMARNVAIDSVAYTRDNECENSYPAQPIERLAAFDALTIIERGGHKHRN